MSSRSSNPDPLIRCRDLAIVDLARRQGIAPPWLDALLDAIDKVLPPDR